MTFALGFLTGMGQAQHEINTRDYHEQLEAEKTANQNTLDMLKGLMSADNVDPETRDTALKSYLGFTQTKGMPTAKHRSSAMEPVMQSFGRKRSSPQANALSATGDRAQTSPDAASDLNTGREDTYSNPNLPSSMGFTSENLPSGQTGPTPLDQAKRNVRTDTMNEVAGSLPKRSGFLQPDEVAILKGNAEGEQMKSRWGALGTDPLTVMGLGKDGSADGNNPVSYVGDPNSKSGIKPVYNSSSFHNYETTDGRKGTARYDIRRGIARDSVTGEILPPGTLMTSPDNTKWITRTNADNTVEQQPVSNLTGESRGPAVDAGVRQTDVQRAATEASARSKDIRTDLAQKNYAIQNDPSAFPGGQLPAGQPIVYVNGQAVAVGTRQYAATKEPGSVLQRASAARSVETQAVDVSKMLTDKSNDDLFGKIDGRISKLMIEGPQAFGLKYLHLGPLGTSDPRLAEIHAALKSMSDLLTTVHGRRSDESAANFYATLDLVHSPEALAAAVAQYGHLAQKIASEGQRPTTDITAPVPGAVPRRNGKGATPVAPPATPAPERKRLSLEEMMNNG